MTPERKAEINRLVAEFEGWHEVEGYWTCELPNGMRRVASALPEYTLDLNALARVEKKLPPSEWHICTKVEDPDCFSAALRFPIDHPDRWFVADHESTEAEARAEAIMQYLDFAGLKGTSHT